jgi:4'-phosphopantetheinyl transferase EntD
LKISDQRQIFQELRWETLSNIRVVLWDRCHQPEAEQLNKLVTPAALDFSNGIRHHERRKEWLATRALSGFLTGQEPGESAVGIPLWSDGWRGSISHKAGHVALWVSLGGELTCGVDLEDSREFEAELSLKFMNSEELRLSSSMIRSTSSALVFAAKEAIYKALCPLVGRKFYFEAVYLKEVIGGQGDYLLKFIVAESLSPEVPIGVEVFVAAKSIRLSDGQYWLALAFFPNFRQTNTL